MRNAHAEPPLAVMDSFPATAVCAGHVQVSCGRFLHEGPRASPKWTAQFYARVWAMSGGPVTTEAVDRLDRAGWPRLDAEGPGFGSGVARARAAHWPARAALAEAAVGVGSPAPRVVLWGELEPEGRGMPFYSRSGAWLMRALAIAGHDELTLYLANVKGADGGRRRAEVRAAVDALARYEPAHVALGRTAERELRQVGVRALKADHPQHWLRFRHAEGERGYAEHLLAAGLPAPLDELARRVDADAAPLAELLDLPLSVAKRKAPTEGDKQASPEATTPREREARLLFVTGQAPTLKEAAKRTGCNASALGRIARHEGWQQQRKDHEDRVFKRQCDGAAASEGQAIARARRLAWECTLEGLAGVLARYRSGELQARPFEAARLGQIALALSGAAAPGEDEELDRLRSLSLGELQEELGRVVGEQFDPGGEAGG